MFVFGLIGFNISAQQNIFKTFSETDGIGNWSTKHGSNYQLIEGTLEVQMELSGTKYRNDLGYNVDNLSENNITLNPTEDVLFAIKFKGERPDGSLKFEMKEDNLDGTTTWHNTEWNVNPNGATKTNEGNWVYYFDLTLDPDYTGTEMVIRQINVTIADAEVEPFEYAVDWIASFSSVADLEKYKNKADDSEEREFFKKTFSELEGLGAWTVESGGAGVILDGHLDVSMADQGTNYRADLWYNDSSSDQLNIGLKPSEEQILAIKFIGDRPDGSLKFEMQQDVNGTLSWMNTQWNGGNADGNYITSSGNTIYYFDLTKDGGYTGSEFLLMRRLHFVIADATIEPYSYSVDWVATFSSLSELESSINMMDDGTGDNDEGAATSTKNVRYDLVSDFTVRTTPGQIAILSNETSEFNIYNISGQLIETVQARTGEVVVNCLSGLYILKEVKTGVVKKVIVK